jgi:hypothetical protein
MVRTALVGVVLLAGCGATAPTPEPTPEPTESLEDRIASYVQTWGGNESQYRVILTLDECENLGRLGIAQQETLDRLDEEGPASTEWRQANGYLGAILERIEEIDCPENIAVP